LVSRVKNERANRLAIHARLVARSQIVDLHSPGLDDDVGVGTGDSEKAAKLRLDGASHPIPARSERDHDGFTANRRRELQHHD